MLTFLFSTAILILACRFFSTALRSRSMTASSFLFMRSRSAQSVPTVITGRRIMCYHRQKDDGQLSEQASRDESLGRLSGSFITSNRVPPQTLLGSQG